MSRLQRLFLGSVVWCTAVTANAAALEGLFEIEIPIQNQGADERTRAIRAGFYELILRLTGTRDAANSPAATALAAKAPEYVVQYRYRAIPATPPVTATPGLAPAMAPTPSTESKQVLWILFDGDTVSQSLYKNRLPFWGRIRPNMVVWLAQEDADRRRLLVDATLPSPVLDAIVSRAKLRGIPLIFPTLDQQDQAILTATDAWNKNSAAILKAAARYQADGVLLGRVQTDSSGRWSSRWTLFMNDAEQNWDMPQETVPVGSEALDRIADDLGRKLAQASLESTPTTAVITVSEVKSLDNYIKTLRYLESLEPVARVRVAKVDGQRATYHLELRGSPEAVARTIASSNVLIVDTASGNPPEVTQTKDAPLAYRLVP
ncbi:MAG: DUF2066 domain-containing protein [Pseudomonadota bacterium]